VALTAAEGGLKRARALTVVWYYAWRNVMSVAKITFGQQCSTLGARYRMRLLSPDGFLPSGPAKPSGRRRQKPCWQQAGVTSETMPKIGVIRESTRTQKVAVRTDDSLSHQPKLD